MEIIVYFFGILSEVTQTSFKYYSNVSSLDDLRLRIEDDFPGIIHYEYRVLINSKIPPDYPVLTDGDEIALVPPLTGDWSNEKFQNSY